jgi:hypothetical protein
MRGTCNKRLDLTNLLNGLTHSGFFFIQRISFGGFSQASIPPSSLLFPKALIKRHLWAFFKAQNLGPTSAHRFARVTTGQRNSHYPSCRVMTIRLVIKVGCPSAVENFFRAKSAYSKYGKQPIFMENIP